MNGITLRPLENVFRVLSWGRGIPSTTLAVMSARGDLEKLDAVLHSDPGWEHQETYEVGDFYTAWLTRRGIHTEVVCGGDIRAEGAAGHKHMPFWTVGGGPLRRQCSRHFKIDPQKRRVRELLGFDPRVGKPPAPGAVEQWIGFTLDEVTRVFPSRVQYIVQRFPLIELRMTRQDCVNYLREAGLPLPPPSSCVGCPYKNAARWLATSEADFKDAVEFDRVNRRNPLIEYGSDGGELYVYRNQVGVMPLSEADFERDARRGALPLFDWNCDSGVCGV